MSHVELETLLCGELAQIFEVDLGSVPDHDLIVQNPAGSTFDTDGVVPLTGAISALVGFVLLSVIPVSRAEFITHHDIVEEHEAIGILARAMPETS